jgi:hypothetical protein
MGSLTITLTETRAIDGWIEAANRNGFFTEVFILEFLASQGKSYADLFEVGIITSAAFIRRFTASEYGAILAAAEEFPEVNSLVNELINSPKVVLDDPRLEPGLSLLVNIGLIEVDRIAELLAYERPGSNIQINGDSSEILD